MVTSGPLILFPSLVIAKDTTGPGPVVCGLWQVMVAVWPWLTVGNRPLSVGFGGGSMADLQTHVN